MCGSHILFLLKTFQPQFRLGNDLFSHNPSPPPPPPSSIRYTMEALLDLEVNSSASDGFRGEECARWCFLWCLDSEASMQPTSSLQWVVGFSSELLRDNGMGMRITSNMFSKIVSNYNGIPGYGRGDEFMDVSAF
ncbi:hypothetical protein DM860_002988 [Cuscuta australis]|uniref:Uncharacterized protein n=1 Tax=Cuscuta australis TaxID=267555 RepID=A0A328D130_9ASTE|nr:hypothetical protein DM860_002988 [Cuscuta australis]